ncbi:MAG: carboxymuconolactone decarboxylase family protein [Hyphomicrobiaceae bacterium]
MTSNSIARLGAAAVLVLLPLGFARAQDVPAPKFMQDTYPSNALASAWQEDQAIEKAGALDAKTKQLIGLAVAAQVPCHYCVYYHTKMAKADGATEAQIKEAIATAALTRKWSTVLNGTNYDMAEFRKEVDEHLAKSASAATGSTTK